MRRVLDLIRERFGRLYGHTSIWKLLRRLNLTWKKGKKLLNKASTEKRIGYIQHLKRLLDAAMHGLVTLVFIDEAHVHQDCDLIHGWAPRGERLWVSSSSPGLSKRVTFYGLYIYNDAQVRIWPAPRANQDETIPVLQRLAEQLGEDAPRPVLIWDGAPYHRGHRVRDAAAELGLEIVPLPGYSPDLMPVEELWRWMRTEVTGNTVHDEAQQLIDAMARFEADINIDPYNIADRLWVVTELRSEEEELRVSK